MNVFRRMSIDGTAFTTAVLLIVLLNAGQYFIGYGGYGFVKGVDPSGLTLGFPFSYYYYAFGIWKGDILYSGIIGDLVFAVAVGCIAGVIASLLKKKFSVK